MQHRLLERARCGKPVTYISPKPSLYGWAFCIGEKMKHYKNWGTVSSGAELYMLNHAERHRKQKKRARKRNEMASDNYYSNVHRSKTSKSD